MSLKPKLIVRAIEKWPKRFKEELSLEEGETFEVWRTSMSGWWYGCNTKTRADGLIPFTKVEVIRGEFSDFGDLSWAEYEHIERTVFDWDLDNVSQVVFQKNKLTCEEQHMLLHALRRLFALLQTEANSTYFLRSAGLDRLVVLLAKTHDIAQRYFIMRNVAFLCMAPAIKRYPAKENVVESVLSTMAECMEFPSFVACACDALCNACFEDETQRRRAVTETKALDSLIAAMKMHREKFGIQLSATRALINLLSEPLAMAKFSEEMMRTVVDSLNYAFGFHVSLEDDGGDIRAREYDAKLAIASGDVDDAGDHHFGDGRAKVGGGLMLQQSAEMHEFATQVLMLLSLTTPKPKLANAFAVSGGFRVLKNLFVSIGKMHEGVRNAMITLLNHMIQDRVVALVFFMNVYEGFDVLCEFLQLTHESSTFFYQCFHLLSYLLLQIDSRKVVKALLRAFERLKVAESISRAVTQVENEKLLECTASIMALSCRTKNAELMRLLMETKLPMAFIPIGINSGMHASHQFLNYCFMAFYNICDKNMAFAYCLYECRLLVWLTNAWYRDSSLPLECVRNGAVAMLNVVKHLPHRLETCDETECARFVGFLEASFGEELADVIAFLKKALDRQSELPQKGSKAAKRKHKEMAKGKVERESPKKKAATEKKKVRSAAAAAPVSAVSATHVEADASQRQAELEQRKTRMEAHRKRQAAEQSESDKKGGCTVM